MNIFIKPGVNADGSPKHIRDPETFKPLAAAGEWKQKTPYWIHRIRDADVVEAKLDEVKPAAADAKPIVNESKPKAERDRARG